MELWGAGVVRGVSPHNLRVDRRAALASAGALMGACDQNGTADGYIVAQDD
jgi:hypothetical protein